MRRHIPRKHDCLPAGRGFHWSLPLLTFSSTRPAAEADSQLACRQTRKASRGKYTQITQLRVSHNLFYVVIPSSKDIPISTAEPTNNMVGFVRCWMFHDYYFMVLLLYHFPDEGRMSSSRKLMHTTTIQIPTALITQKYHISYPGFRLDFLLPSSRK